MGKANFTYLVKSDIQETLGRAAEMESAFRRIWLKRQNTLGSLKGIDGMAMDKLHIKIEIM